MKKLLLSVGALSMTLLMNAQVQRTVLIEEFTNASCGPCASQNPAFNTLLANNPTKIVQVKYQTVWPGVDPMNAQNTTDVATRVTKFGVSGVPFAVVDGDTNKNPATAQAYAGAPFNVTQTMIDNEYALTTPISIVASYSYNATTDSITSVVTVKNESASAVNASAAGNIRLQFALLEMNINYATAPGTNGETDFHYVMRKMYPSAAGTVLPDILVPGTPYTYTFKEKAPSYIYKKAQMAIAVFVEDNGTTTSQAKVYQAKLGLPSNTVDAVAEYTGNTVAPSYCSATINPSIKITNNGTTNLTAATVAYTVNGAAGSSQNWSGNLASGQSATVSFPAITAPTGTNTYKFSITALNPGSVDLNNSNDIMDPITTKVVSTLSSPYYEGFESAALGDNATSQSLNNNPGGSYVVDKTVLSTLTQKLGAYGLTDKSYRFRFYNVPAGVRMGLVSHKSNISSKGYKTITFDYAYNNYTDANGSANDSLAVKVSTDCGATWTEIWNKAGTDLKTTTAAGISSAYYPKTTEWMAASADIPAAMQNASEILVMMEGQSGFGNNLYIDNIRFWFPLGVDNVDEANNISVYPNPTNSVLNISGLTETHYQISLVDVLGRTMKSFEINSNNNAAKIDVSGITKGNYILKINSKNNTVTKSVTIIE